ncbi:hypothetical protein V8D89_000773 [Ganoderma adspersum]
MAANVPPAPQLSGNSVLEVFVHHSSSAQGARFRILGERQLKLAYTSALIEKRPSLSGDHLTHYININYPVFVAYWVNTYGWRARMWAVPPDVNLNDPAETLTIFEVYAGAVVDECREPGGRYGDPRILLRWIRELVYISD